VPEQLLSDDETRAAFADLRATALADVKAPGPGVARRAVRRRRHLTSAGAGLTVVAVAGGVAAAFAGGPSTAPPTAPSQTAAAVSAPAAAEAGRLQASAPNATEKPFTVFEKTVDAGLHRYTVLCSGTGSGTATLTAAGRTATATVTCATPPARSTIELEVAEHGAELTLRVDWAPGQELRDTADGWAIRVLGA
jgi:hypothetical protein